MIDPLAGLEAILNAFPCAVLLVDGQIRLQQANIQAERELQLKATGQYLQEAMPNIGAVIAECIQRKKPRETKFIREQGTFYECEISLIDLNAETPGSLVCLYASEDSVTYSGLANLLKAQRTLNDQLQTMFNSSNDGIWITDGQGTILDINAASAYLNQIETADFIGRNIQAIVDFGLVDRSVVLEVLSHQEQRSINQYITRT